MFVDVLTIAVGVFVTAALLNLLLNGCVTC
jgi:hypothetical protein